jgi:hypothetical protein
MKKSETEKITRITIKPNKIFIKIIPENKVANKR